MDAVLIVGTLAAIVMISLVLAAAAGKVTSHHRGVRNLMLGLSTLVALSIGLLIVKWIWA